jgi:16S rRNA (guanine1207-N2)-methyltransferase
MIDQPRSTRALLALTDIAADGPALDVGSHLGAVAQGLGCPYVHTDLVACEDARRAGVADVQHFDLLPRGSYRTIFFDAREYDPGHAAETVASAARQMAPGGVLVTTARLTDLQACFERVEEHGEAFVARQPVTDPPSPPWGEYEAEFGGQTYRIQSAPGLFSPRGMDAGTQLMLGLVEAGEGARFLDLGCGAGVVSRIASEAWGCQVTAVDVNARALRMTALNAPKAEVVASNGFAGLTGRQFDIIASNPPYHTDFGVAKAFIEGAYSHLPVGGTLYLVIKRADWYVQKVRALFGGCRVVEDNGYTVVITEKREPKPRKAEPTPPAMTKKHAKRMAAAGSNKRRPR